MLESDQNKLSHSMMSWQTSNLSIVKYDERQIYSIEWKLEEEKQQSISYGIMVDLASISYINIQINEIVNFHSHLLLSTSYSGVFLVMTMQVATSVNMLKPNPLILLPSLPTSLNNEPEDDHPIMKHQQNRKPRKININLKKKKGTFRSHLQ